MFKREWFNLWTGVRPVLNKVVRYWDKAGTKDGRGAESAGVLMASYTDHAAQIDAMKGKYLVLDAIVFRKSAAEREKVIKDTAMTDVALYGPSVETWVEQEPGSGGKESAESTVGNLAGFDCRIERVTGAKEIRAEPFASQASVGKVSYVPGEWNRAFLDELEMFPLGNLKDMVDGASGAFNKLCQPSGALSSAEGIWAGPRDAWQPRTFTPRRLHA
jgi:predicted phage terminase large subunit-like protein